MSSIPPNTFPGLSMGSSAVSLASGGALSHNLHGSLSSSSFYGGHNSGIDAHDDQSHSRSVSNYSHMSGGYGNQSQWTHAQQDAYMQQTQLNLMNERIKTLEAQLIEVKAHRDAYEQQRNSIQYVYTTSTYMHTSNTRSGLALTSLPVP
ncbi:hypothetical protein CONPUDRAFT_160623 [Coniophora puteana RWD-64-598 SS2]|uniref:Uncharacterized protein n=1 Tax=Coniophora puteana (strain RWD-64-598) TaxID=741705 RepID=R7SFK6_CONPW|nr:uncharacterized protein CONPUDRAFT_160623 [Coniophora puteana RWD-64-598 SS2]EIW73864.1 hypothetical protein CONPUDRAFT_160623 [Coniophora puteana RWD-64-598 SS2]